MALSEPQHTLQPKLFLNRGEPRSERARLCGKRCGAGFEPQSLFVLPREPRAECFHLIGELLIEPLNRRDGDATGVGCRNRFVVLARR